MKNISTIVSCFLMMIFCAPEFTLVDALNKKQGTLYIYTYQYAELKNVQTIKNGNSYILSCNLNQGKSVLKQLNKTSIRGLSAEFEGTMQSIMQLKKTLKLCVKFEETLENIYFLYAYSPAFSEFTTYNGEKINVQIALTNNKIHFGVPLILGSI